MVKFDITKHKWSDRTVDVSDNSDNDILHLYCGQAGEVKHNRDDAIAIAKYFGLLPSDKLVVTDEDKLKHHLNAWADPRGIL